MTGNTTVTTLLVSAPTATVPLSSPGRLQIPSHQYKGLDPEWRALWNAHGGSMVRAEEVTLDEYRADPAKHSFTYPTYRGPDVLYVQDHQIPVSRPAGEITKLGGWVLGGLKTEAARCRHICNKSAIKVVDVDYRIGPEFKFPTAIYDCWNAVKWVTANAESLNINPESVSFGGLSAGGQMSAVLEHFARDEGVDIKLHLMIVPATDMRYCSPKFKELTPENCPYESAHLFEDLPWGSLGREQWFRSIGLEKTLMSNSEP
ncbi:hypothetical protein QQZ08_010660 [Neonectria magnoliae]|uniref:Alpha/beta hydrolase fold-3 domain-containing protein n=1 Tax=Neonectria magnoliae TaxID=2732573 RepID=A0ABR1HFV0_9HYPO